jgi:hypothetical protein
VHELIGAEGSGTSVRICNNIIGSEFFVGTGVNNNNATAFSYSRNLVFGFGSATGGVITDGGGNHYVPSDNFSEVFSSSRDVDLSDGDSSDYHLSDTSPGSPYAIDLGAYESPPE